KLWNWNEIDDVLTHRASFSVCMLPVVEKISVRWDIHPRGCALLRFTWYTVFLVGQGRWGFQASGVVEIGVPFRLRAQQQVRMFETKYPGFDKIVECFRSIRGLVKIVGGCRGIR
ncbi:unnamed protein product, partial [Laminaria digitata]